MSAARLPAAGVLLLVALSGLGVPSARGELRPPVYDTALIDRDRIVIGRIDPGSLKRGRNESTATLLIQEVLKGPDDKDPLTVRIRMMVLIGGHYEDEGTTVNLRGGRQDYPKDRIELHEGRGDFGSRDEKANLAENAVWFLDREEDEYRISRAAQVQPLKFKPFFEALLADDTDLRLPALLGDKDTEVQMRTLRYVRELHRPTDLKDIMPLLDSADDKVRMEAAWSAAEVADISGIPLFRKLLDSPKPEVRERAVWFLCRFRDLGSLDAIPGALRDMDDLQRCRVALALRRMNSRTVVPILLTLLDDDGAEGRLPGPTIESTVAWRAAQSLREITCVFFPLDTRRARALWEKLDGVPDEVLLRKAVLSDIKALTRPDHEVRWHAYRTLSQVVNTHFGSYNAFHNAGEEGKVERTASQKLWMAWADEGITRSRRDWIYDGFKTSGIELPRPMTREGIDVLIDVLRFYGGGSREYARQAHPWWEARGGWPQADSLCHNANLLLEHFTGHTVGYSPYHHDLQMTWNKGDVLVERWAQWWKVHRDKTELKPWPREVDVAREMLENAPELNPPPDPLVVVIRPSKTVYAKDEHPVIHVTVKNVSDHPVTLARRPRDVRYNSRSGSGSSGHDKGVGRTKKDFVTLEPGETIEWDHEAAFSNTGRPVEDFRYQLHYPVAGRAFGLHAWRGVLHSNPVDYRFAE